MRAFALIPVVLILAACGAAEPESEPPVKQPDPPPVAVGEPVVYETTVTVLEDESHGPMLCLGGVATSDPPQCGLVPIANWDWNTIEGEEAHSGTTWGNFHVVGTYDGETFTLVEAGPPEPLPEEAFEGFEAACDEPAGGWVVPEQGRTTNEQDDELGVWAQKQEQYVASWVSYLEDPADILEQLEAGYEGSFPIVFNIVVNADRDAIESGARKLWDGPLCVVERDVPTQKEAMAIRAEAEASLEEYGLVMVGSTEGEVGEAAEIWVVADPGGAGQAIMDERFGPGLIRLVPQLTPVN